MLSVDCLSLQSQSIKKMYQFNQLMYSFVVVNFDVYIAIREPSKATDKSDVNDEVPWCLTLT